MNLLPSFEPEWFWLALGLLLAVGEMLAPALFLIWMAGAALVTGLIAWLLPIDWALQVVLFALLAMSSVLAGRMWLRRHPSESSGPRLNDRGGRAVGEVVVVSQVISGGQGKVRLGDSEWLARGPDAEPGSRMRVAGHEGTVLMVEHLH